MRKRAERDAVLSNKQCLIKYLVMDFERMRIGFHRWLYVWNEWKQAIRKLKKQWVYLLKLFIARGRSLQSQFEVVA